MIVAARRPRPSGERRAGLIEAFAQRFGSKPDGIASAPGRVNLIGEHVDYNDGFVLPVAIDLTVMAAFARRDDDRIRTYASDLDNEFVLRLGESGVRADYPGWASYIRSVVGVLTKASGQLAGADLLISSDLPWEVGLSSSAALEVAAAGALREVSSLEISNEQLAVLCQRAEHDAVSVECGVMDQMASALARQGHALLIDCRTLSYEHIPLPFREHGVVLAVVHSGQHRELVSSAYNRRRQECREALALLQRSALGRAPQSLRDVTIEDLKAASLPGELLRRAHHVVTECARVKQSTAALSSGDLERLGRLMYESHVSLRDDFEVSTPELDRLVELTQDTSGTWGARLTGAGFGGCTVNLVQEHALEGFATNVVERFARETGLVARMFVCEASDGLRVHRPL